MWIVVIIVGIIIILGCIPIHRGMSDEEAKFSDKAYRLHMRGMDAKTSKKAEEILNEYELLYSEVENETRLLDRHIYDEDLDDIRDNMESLAKEEREEKARRILDRFAELYYLITDPDFKDVEKAYKSKKRCIDYWQKYFFSIPEDGIWRDPKAFMKEYLADDFDECMYNHDTLEKKLSKCIEEMKPEYKRKINLRHQILDIVAEKESIMRAELVSMPFDGCTKKEVEYCIKELVDSYQLVALKIGNRYFISLPDKEKDKRNRLKKKVFSIQPEIMAKSASSVLHDSVIKYLADNGLDYIDKTSNGGGIYFFNEQAANHLIEKGYGVRFAASGTRSTSGRPAWYITFK